MEDKEIEVSGEQIQQLIFIVRRQKVILSTHLAELYQVEPRVLVQAVKRNIDRFPADFMFQLTDEEFSDLKSQIVISSWGGLRRATPYAFTEQGVAMLSSVLRSKRAVQVNIQIMRAFVRLREMLPAHIELASKLQELEERIEEHDDDIKMILLGRSWSRREKPLMKAAAFSLMQLAADPLYPEEVFLQKADDEVLQPRELAPEPGQIKRAVCQSCRINDTELLVSRRGVFNEPRNVAIYLMRRVRGDSLRQIGEQFQMRKYSSVSSVIERMKVLLSKDRKLRVRVKNFIPQLSKN